ncbi:MAG: UdgX family uracil-DNA binding protein [Planctomycetota bacterium]
MTASETLLSVRAVAFDDWRISARRLLINGRSPETIHWIDDRSSDDQRQQGLFDDDAAPASLADDETAAASSPFRVPKPFIELARRVACHRSPRRWELLYRLLWRMTGGDRKLLSNLTDPDVRLAGDFEKAIRRDVHKMKAFVRFRKVVDELGEHFIAWHRPDHHIVELAAPFFTRRFDVMRWTIMTPGQSAFWDGSNLSFGDGLPRSEAPKDDELESLWKTYYAHIFNPARIKLQAMRAEMPKKHWATMPETQLIDDMLRDAPQRVETMIRHAEGGVTAKPFIPEVSAGNSDLNQSSESGTSLEISEAPRSKSACRIEELRQAAAACQGCSLHEPATQTVFGRGNPAATLVLIGEQPGDQEDLAGQPFVGPAGQVLREVLDEVDLDPDDLYVTNAVKHFKFKPTSKRRLHVKPAAREIAACRPWLESEIEAIRPPMVVCLGATAANVVFGPAFRITKQRGEVMKTDFARWSMATYHPSALLRVPEQNARDRMRGLFASDLRTAADHLRMLQQH